jgi:PPK2 family polyphosphate:nucleotide phosphotransferase
MARHEDLIERYRVTNGRKFRLKDIDPDDTHDIKSKEQAEILLQEGVAELSDLQERLYAQDRWGILCIFQAMDAAGKDGTIKHVMSGINPQGCQVSAFKVPSPEELDHDFLWRTSRHLPERGRIGIFNRSYYEETLVVRVHPEFLERQRLPASLVTKKIWDERHEDINGFERYLTRNGYVVLKFFLHVSKDEQLRRFLSRLEEPEKHWKFSLGDVHERAHWDAYMSAYEKTIRATATPHAPWYVVPADHKWFTRLVVSAAIVDALAALDLHFPRVDEEKRKELESARSTLVGDEGPVAETVTGLAADDAAQANASPADAPAKGKDKKKGRKKDGKKGKRAKKGS